MTRIALLIAGLSAFALAACGNGPEDPQEANPDETNSSAQTDANAAELGEWGVDLSAMKPSVEPGDDFFRHANGSWLETFEIPPDKTSYGSFLVLRDRSEERVRTIIEDLADSNPPAGGVEAMIADYYASYMDTETVNAKGIAPLEPLLADIDAISDRDALIGMLGRAGREGLDTPIGGGIGLDRKNPDRYIVNLGHSGLSLPDKSYYLEDNERFAKIREAYRSHIARMLGLAGIEDAESKAEAVLALETEIARHHWERAELRNRDKTYNIYKFADLGTEFPGFDWGAFFAAAGLQDFDELNVNTPSAIAPLIEVVNETPLETWKAYLAFNAITSHARVLSEAIAQANFEFFGKVLSGQQEQRPRWARGVQLVSGGRGGGLGEAIGQVYVDRHFPEESKRMMEDLVENLREAFRRRINALDWMGEETKKEALDKLETFNPKIGYPDKWRDYTGLEIAADDLFGNFVGVRAFLYDDQVSRLNKPAERWRWFMTPQTVNAYYNSSWNEIVFPAAILQPPFFDPNADMAVNYGGIGGVIGHEMGHGFDDQGSKSDARGIQRNWWTEADRERFEERTKALGAQYESYEPIAGENVNGALTMGENIGDLGGLSIAYEAYKIALEGKEPPVNDGLTGDQRFFLGWAQVWRAKDREQTLLRRIRSDPHSPAEFRVNGVVRNMDAWYEAFDVGPDDALYIPPEERVRIW